VSKPKILLGDEPTAALDKESGRAVVNLMQELAKEQQTTIIMVTHDNKILDVADRIIIVDEGKLASAEEENLFIEKMRSSEHS
jgi:putative ABC transport system ATP-binding protein